MHSLLKRRSVTKEILFSYLHDKNIPVKLPLTKIDVIEKITEYWEVPMIKLDSKTSEESIENISKTHSTEICVSRNDHGIDSLAEHFVKWFFGMVNQKEEISSHFFNDSRCKITFYDVNIDCKVIENNPQDIGSTLLSLSVQNKLFFNPNFTSDGVQGRMDPHGLVMVLVCGTLHHNENCVGVFEQVFALARDPFSENNWKIKSTELNLRVKNVDKPPCLTDSDLTNDVLLSLPNTE